MDNINHKSSSALTIISILLASLLVFSLGCVKKEEKEIKIGAILPLTGNYAQYGNYFKQGMELALDDAINQGLLKKEKVKLIFEDGQADPAKSVAAFKKLTEVDKVVACIPATSGVILAIKPIANKNKVVVLNASAISTDIEDSADFIFSVIPNAKHTGYFLAETAFNRLGKRNAGLLYRNDASGKSFIEHFTAKFKELGGKIIIEESHEPNNTDFRGHITKLSAHKKIDIIFVASWGPEVANYVMIFPRFHGHSR